MANILLLGSSGQLGVELQRLLPETDLHALSRRDVDLTDGHAIRSVIRRIRPGVIVNAAAYTAVDRAESEPELARAVNAIAPAIMAEEARSLDAWLLHFSTDYVFDGSSARPWIESDTPNPLNVYGRTKLEGERGIASTGCRHLIFRTSWVYASHGANFLRTILRLAGERDKLTIVDDQTGAPTSATQLARATAPILKELSDQSRPPLKSGIYHMTCSGSTTWFGFAQAIIASSRSGGRTPEVIPISTEQYPTPARRPRNSTLNCDKLERTMGIRLAPWQSALDEVMAELDGRRL